MKIKEMKIKEREVSLLITSVVVGLLIAVQSRAFTDVSTVFGRDTRADAFRELQILKKSNEKLEDEISDLQSQLSKANDQEQSLKGIRDEIQKYQILTGRTDVSGPGLRVTLNGNVQDIWLTDMTNELLSAGAEAISINNIRLIDVTNGFDTIPNGEIVLNGSILKAPYVFEAIGDKTTLKAAIEQPQGILQRMSQNLTGVDVKVEEKDLVSMEKVL